MSSYVIIISLDFSKAFDTVRHLSLLQVGSVFINYKHEISRMLTYISYVTVLSRQCRVISLSQFITLLSLVVILLSSVDFELVIVA